MKLLQGKSFGIIWTSETKLDEILPQAQFAIEGFSKPYLDVLDEILPQAQFATEGFSKPYLDVTLNSEGLLFYVKVNLSSKLVRSYNFPIEIQCMPIELNISNKTYALLSIYQPPNQKAELVLSQQMVL